MPKGYTKLDRPERGREISQARQAQLNVKSCPPTESWWTCPPEQWADKARDAAIRMNAVDTTNYRLKNHD